MYRRHLQVLSIFPEAAHCSDGSSKFSKPLRFNVAGHAAAMISHRTPDASHLHMLIKLQKFPRLIDVYRVLEQALIKANDRPADVCFERIPGLIRPPNETSLNIDDVP